MYMCAQIMYELSKVFGFLFLAKPIIIVIGVLKSILCGPTDPASPSAPQNLTANDIGATWVVLTWSQPVDTGLGGDLSYKVFYQDIKRTLSNMTTTTTYHNVTGLSPNTTYTMTVTADNGIPGNEENRIVSVNVTTKATDTSTTGVLSEHCDAYMLMHTPMHTYVFNICTTSTQLPLETFRSYLFVHTDSPNIGTKHEVMMVDLLLVTVAVAVAVAVVIVALICLCLVVLVWCCIRKR